MDLEQELKEKIKKAREEATEQEEPVAEESAKEEPVVEEEIKEPQDDNPVDEKLEEKLEEEFEEEEIEEELEIEPDSEEYKKLDSKGKKFAHMRKEAKEKERKIQELAERLARIEGAQSVKSEPVVQEVKEEVIPDKDLEPEEWMDYQLKKRDEQIEKLSSKIEANTEQSSQQKAEIVYRGLESDYAEKDTTYMDAKKFLIAKNSQEIKEQYPNATQAQIDAHIKVEEYKLVKTMSKGGLNSDMIFKVIKNMAVDGGYTEIVPKKRDKAKLKENIRKSANLNDVPGSNEDIGFSESKMARMKSADFHKLAHNPKDMKKAMKALKAARIKASG